jgi:predicted site-specific integrase-resolvase
LITEKRFLKRRDVLRQFGIHRNTFSNWIKQGKISTVVINKHHYVPEQEIIRLTNERKQHIKEERLCNSGQLEIV